MLLARRLLSRSNWDTLRLVGSLFTTLDDRERPPSALRIVKSSMKQVNTLEQEDFDSLLRLFAEDRETAGEVYEKLRKGLVSFFRYRGCADPDSLADETFNRVAARAASFDRAGGTEPAAFIYGFARNIYLESTRDPRNKETAIDDANALRIAATEKEPGDPALDCLQKCLGKLKAEDRDLIIKYYSREKQAKIEVRGRLAEQFGCSRDALHFRVFRIRKTLLPCVKQCMEQF